MAVLETVTHLIARQEQMEGIIPAPPGVTPQFDHPASHARTMVVAGIVCPILAAVFLAARCSSKMIAGSWGWDDYTSIVALLFSVALTVTSVIPADRYGLGSHAWDVRVESLTPLLKYSFAESLTYDLGIYMAKLSILLLFYRIFGVNQNFRWAVYAVTAIWTMFVIANTLLIIFACIPVHKAWDPLVQGHCISLTTIAVAGGYINIITDFMILVLPVPMVWALQLKERIRFALIGIFATATFACVTSIIRQVEIVRAQSNADITWLNSNSLLWLIIELNIGIICGCMPTLKPLLRKTLWQADPKTQRVHSYEYNKRSNLKNSVNSKLGDGLMDASYIELGPPGTNRDVHIAAESSRGATPWVGHASGAILKTETFGQDVSYKDPRNSL